jgi:hypothetical protein
MTKAVAKATAKAEGTATLIRQKVPPIPLTPLGRPIPNRGQNNHRITAVLGVTLERSGKTVV